MLIYCQKLFHCKDRKVSEKAHCGCEDCQLFTKQILYASSQGLDFFKQLGVDPTKEAEVCRAIPNKDGFDTYSADYHFIGAIQGTDDLDWIQVGEASFGLANQRFSKSNDSKYLFTANCRISCENNNAPYGDVIQKNYSYIL